MGLAEQHRLSVGIDVDPLCHRQAGFRVIDVQVPLVEVGRPVDRDEHAVAGHVRRTFGVQPCGARRRRTERSLGKGALGEFKLQQEAVARTFGASLLGRRAKPRSGRVSVAPAPRHDLSRALEGGVRQGRRRGWRHGEQRREQRCPECSPNPNYPTFDPTDHPSGPLEQATYAEPVPEQRLR